VTIRQIAEPDVLFPMTTETNAKSVSILSCKAPRGVLGFTG
jgi:hypothetical protein